jgi:hypothetical protein
VAEVIDIADVWSGHDVEFSLVTRGERQFAAYYDAERRMTVASRSLGSTQWQTVTLPSTLGWDSHNHVRLALDELGHVHVAGNMHNVPLIYFRTRTAFDISTLEPVASMVGREESSVTYPRFFTGPEGRLFFAYRDGQSGDGNQLFDAYDAEARVWSRWLDTPLLDGEDLYSTYPAGPFEAPDASWHLVWVWRDTPDVSTNHDLSYARSSDLVEWESAAREPLALPITLGASELVDPLPTNSGITNRNMKIGFDAQSRPIISYLKYDAAGNTQLYNARFEDGVWTSHQTSNWDYRWEVSGLGTLVLEIELRPIELQSDGTLSQRFYHPQYGGWGAFQIDQETLTAVAEIEPRFPYPLELDVPESSTPEMVTRWQADDGRSPDPGVVYLLRWETLPSNRDEPRENVPPPTPLRLYGFETGR